jgi:hypothetical protein
MCEGACEMNSNYCEWDLWWEGFGGCWVRETGVVS